MASSWSNAVEFVEAVQFLTDIQPPASCLMSTMALAWEMPPPAANLLAKDMTALRAAKARARARSTGGAAMDNSIKAKSRSPHWPYGGGTKAHDRLR